MKKTNKRVRMDTHMRQEYILDAAIKLALQKGYKNVTRNGLADFANIAPALLNHHFVTMDNIRRAVVQRAIEREIIPIIAQSLIEYGENTIHRLKPELQEKVIHYLTH
jgi:AcrR family transcriptional regulator